MAELYSLSHIKLNFVPSHVSHSFVFVMLRGKNIEYSMLYVQLVGTVKVGRT